VFEYKALNASGKKKSGIVDADNISGARKKLKAQSLFPFALNRIDAEAGETKKNRGIPSGLPKLFSRISSAELLVMTRLLSTLLSAGFPLVKAVAEVGEQIRSKPLSRVLSGVKNSIEQGAGFAESLGLFPHVFSPVYINMVAAGESSGTLEIVLDRLADFSEKREETRKKIWASLAYPIVMSVIGFMVVVILMAYIVPGIIGIFTDMNQTLPLPTRILIFISDFFTAYWWAVLLLPCILTGLLIALRRTPKGALLTDQALLMIPVAGGLVVKLASARFSRTLGSLLAHGVPLMTALDITRNVTGNLVISNLIQEAAEKVERGGQLGDALAGNRVFPKLAVQMIRIGEKSGEMEKMLEKSADLYEKDVQTAITAATALIEPLVILAMGVVVGLIIMAVCLPIVEINQFVF